MIPKPKHLWKLNEGEGITAFDSAGSICGEYSPLAKLIPATQLQPAAVQTDGTDNSFVSFGISAGQFGTANFTVALWFKTSETHRYFDILGNRTSGTHGNFFCIRMTGRHEALPEGMIVTEVDDNGMNFISVKSIKTGLNDGQWHHIAVVRNGISLKLYIDGAASGQGHAFGVANISNGNEFKLGRSLIGLHEKFAPVAQFRDIYIFGTALADSEVESLIPVTEKIM